MSRTATFGIIGGYGATGKKVASELAKSVGAEVLIGGRDFKKANGVAAEIGGSVSAAQVDVLDSGALDNFCCRCSILVNCAGPVFELQDRVAQAALRARCHYVDPAGMTFVKERMLAHQRELEDLGLSFVVSAGWNPGITELLPVYAHARAREKMDAIESLTAYCGDSGEWSTNALRDGAWFIRRTGMKSPGYFRKGVWTRAKTSQAFRREDLGEPIGRRRFGMFALPELAEVGQRLKDCDVYTYNYLSGYRTAIATTVMAMIPLPEKWNVSLLRSVFRRNQLPVDGFVAVDAVGSSEGRSVVLKVRIFYKERRDYWINAVALATVARMISRGDSVRPGVHFLADAVDPIAFLAELRSAGVETIEPQVPVSYGRMV
jgi:saccharopine dehydrogenase (NAD+, L-lysine-forming)